MKYFLLFYILILINPVIAQNNDSIEKTWMNSDYLSELYPDNIYFKALAEDDRVWFWQKKREINKMTEVLKRDLGQKIHINVRSEEYLSVSTFYDLTQFKYIERYSSEVFLTSDINLTQSRLEFHYDRNERKLYGLIFIEKRVLAEHYLGLIRRESDLLNNQLESNLAAYTDASITRNYIDFYETCFKRILSFSNIVISSDHNLSDGIIELMGSLRIKIDDVYQHLDHDYFYKKLTEAHNQMLTGNNKEAYLIFIELALINPGTNKIQYGLNESMKNLEYQYLNEIAQHRINQEYHDAVIKYDELFGLLPKIRESHIGIYHDLEKKAFRHYSRELKNAIRNNNIESIRNLISKLSKYSHINHSEYLSIKKLVDKTLANDFYEQANINYHNENYTSTISLLKMALEHENTRKYRRLDNITREKIFRQRLNSLKKTRPYKYALHLGAGLQHNMDLFDYYMVNESLNISYIPIYSVGMYRKFNISPNIRSNGADFSRANIFGFKYTYTNFTKQYHFHHGFVTIPLQNLQELEMVIGISNTVNLSFGTVYNDFNTQILTDNIFHTVTLSTRSYFLRNEFNIDLKGYIADNKVYPVLKIGKYLNFNFIREIYRHDKQKIRYDISNL